MAAKKFFITQSVMVDNQKRSKGFTMFADLADVEKLTALMEGKFTIKEQTKVINPTADETSIPTADINYVSSIVCTTPLSTGEKHPTYINSYDKSSLMFKKTSDAKKIRDLLLTVKMLQIDLTALPTSVTVKDSTR